MNNKTNKEQKASKKPTVAQLTAELEKCREVMAANSDIMSQRCQELLKDNEVLNQKLADRATLEKINAELLAQLKSLGAPKPEAPTSLHLDELDIEIEYDKEQNGKPKNYWGRLVNATINSNGSRFFQLLVEDGQYRMFNKSKTVNAEEVGVAVEKMFALRRQAAQDELFTR